MLSEKLLHIKYIVHGYMHILISKTNTNSIQCISQSIITKDNDMLYASLIYKLYTFYVLISKTNTNSITFPMILISKYK